MFSHKCTFACISVCLGGRLAKSCKIYKDRRVCSSYQQSQSGRQMPEPVHPYAHSIDFLDRYDKDCPFTLPFNLGIGKPDGHKETLNVQVISLDRLEGIYTADWKLNGLASGKVTVKIARDEAHNKALFQEARMYIKYLGPLEDKYAPRFYGYYRPFKTSHEENKSRILGMSVFSHLKFGSYVSEENEIWKNPPLTL